jgi:hypothetical protein
MGHSYSAQIELEQCWTDCLYYSFSALIIESDSSLYCWSSHSFLLQLNFIYYAHQWLSHNREHMLMRYQWTSMTPSFIWFIYVDPSQPSFHFYLSTKVHPCLYEQTIYANVISRHCKLTLKKTLAIGSWFFLGDLASSGIYLALCSRAPFRVRPLTTVKSICKKKSNL